MNEKKGKTIRAEIEKLLDEGKTTEQIRAHLHCDRSYIWNIHRTWAEKKEEAEK